MRKLHVAFIYSNRKHFPRSVGWFAYDVPEFDVVHFPVSETAVISRATLAKAGFDVAIWEDDKAYGGFVGAGVPVAYVIVDSTLSPFHFQQRLICGRQADLLLVDSDRLSRFHDLRKPTRRFAYCVNDEMARDYGEEKTVDVCFHAHIRAIPIRLAVRDELTQACRERGLDFAIGKICNSEAYLRAFNRARISVHAASIPQTRAHRIFDVMACRSALLSSQLPPIEGDEITAGVHYVDYGRPGDLGPRIDEMLRDGAWRQIAEAGYNLVRARHTWAIRARELREILSQELGL